MSSARVQNRYSCHPLPPITSHFLSSYGFVYMSLPLLGPTSYLRPPTCLKGRREKAEVRQIAKKSSWKGRLSPPGAGVLPAGSLTKLWQVVFRQAINAVLQWPGEVKVSFLEEAGLHLCLAGW